MEIKIKSLKFCIPSFLLLIYLIHANALDNNSFIGGRGGGMSGAVVAHSDVWSVFNNQAGLGKVNKISFAGYNENLFNTMIGTKALGFILPTRTGNFGLLFTNYGMSSFLLQKFGLAYGKQLGNNFLAGLQLDYFNLNLPENYGHDGSVTFEAGFITTPVNNLSVGAHVFNPVRSTFETANQAGLPPVLKVGLEYLF